MWMPIQVRRLLISTKDSRAFQVFTRVCPHFKNGDKNEINFRQTRKNSVDNIEILTNYLTMFGKI